MLVHNACGGWNTVRESSKATNTIKGFTKNQMQVYDDVLEKLASGNTSGLNIHRLSTGNFAADLHGFGKGRGAGRVIYQIKDGIIDIIEVTVNHYKR